MPRGAEGGGGLRDRVAAVGLGLLLSLSTLLGLTTTAQAQTAPAPSGSAGPGAPTAIVPPRIAEFIDADYPPLALAARIEGSVVLRLSIDKTGQVVNAEVVEPAGHGFDEAAVNAVRRFRFEPARRGDAAVGARILYRYTFRLPAEAAAPPPPPPPPPPPTTAVLTGHVVDAGARQPIAGAEVIVMQGDREIGRTTTDAEGRFSLADLAAGPARITVSRGGATEAKEVQLDPSHATELTLSLAAPAEQGTSPLPLEVLVHGQQSEAQKRRESAEAVTVVAMQRAQEQSRDLGEVLSSVEGVAVRRSGGLGSLSRISLNGLYDEQIRFFFDEIPLDIAGFPFGIASVPVNLVERIEIYRGVMPIRFGADALGGAVNLVPDKRYDTRAAASYQRGSFGTHRISLLGRYRHEPSGFVAGGTGWLDIARNDYDVDVEIPDKTGRQKLTRVPLLHGAYRARGGSLEVGFVDRPWANRLILTLFGSSFDKDIPHDAYMTEAVGQARYGQSVLGATARYDEPLTEALLLSAVASATRSTLHFVDKSPYSYDWFGNPSPQPGKLGELLPDPHDATVWQGNFFGRGQLEWRLRSDQTLRLASTGRFFTRNGHESATTTRDGGDPLAPQKNLFTLMTGVEHEVNAFDMRPPEQRSQAADPAQDDRLQNVVFLKHYFYAASSEGVFIHPTLQRLSASKHFFGLGDGARFRFTSWLASKVSYELATRLPTVDELYGDGVLILPNVDLVPEISHNANLTLQLDLRRTPLGRISAVADGFLRDTSKLISQTSDGMSVQYKNVYSARAQGVEGSLSWSSPGDWVALGGNATWQDVRNTSHDGEFASYAGDRIPNRPWLFANWSARLQWHDAASQIEVSPFYLGRYIYQFYRTWESIGDRRFKALIPTQIAHSVGVTYTAYGPMTCKATLQVDNLLDAKIYDFFGVQRPGRSVSLKVTGEI